MFDQPTISFPIGAHNLQLVCSASVFMPNTTTTILFEAAPQVAGLRVLDMGCGVGPIAIACALSGAAAVIAVDIMQEACTLTAHNAQRNGVCNRIQVLRSFGFAEVDTQPVDLIISDISGMAEEVARITPWYPLPIPTGGSDGTDLAIEVIRNSPNYLQPGGKLIFPILSLSRASLIKEAAFATFGSSLSKIVEKLIPFHPALYEHRIRLEELKEQGIIDFTARGSRLCWSLTVYCGERSDIAM